MQEQRMPNTMKYSPMRNMFFSSFVIVFGKIGQSKEKGTVLLMT